jgi:hypothetical protein
MFFGLAEHLVGWHVEEFRVRVNKSANEPGASDAINFGVFTRNPLHRVLLAIDKILWKM